MSSYNPFSWAMNAVSSPEASRKRKADDMEETDLTLESIMGEIDGLKKSNERIEKMLKTLLAGTKTEDDDEKEEDKEEASDEEEEDEEEEENPEDLLNASWLKKFEELRKFKAKHGHCKVAKSGTNPELGRWIVRQRSEKKTGNMSLREIKIAKLNSLDFDWTPQANTPAKKRRK